MVQKLRIFVEGGAGRGGRVEIIRFAYRFHSLHPKHSYTHNSDGCSTQQRQKNNQANNLDVQSFHG